MKIFLPILLLPVFALGQSAASTGRYATLRVSGTLYSSGITSTNTTSTTLTTATAATGGNDYGLIINNSATLTGDSNHTDRLVSVRNNGTAVHEFFASGKYQVTAPANNASPGFRFATPSGGILNMRLAGGSSELAFIESDNTIISFMAIGNCPATNCILALGPNANNVSQEILIYKGTNGPTIKFNVMQGLDSTDSSASPGAATNNDAAGLVAVAAGASSVVVTNSQATTTTVPVLQQLTNDSTCQVKSAVRASGSFTINMTANCTAATTIFFELKRLM